MKGRNPGQLSGFDLQPELRSEPLLETSYIKYFGLSSTVARGKDGAFSNNGQEHELRTVLIFLTTTAIHTSVAQAEQLGFVFLNKIHSCKKERKKKPLDGFIILNSYHEFDLSVTQQLTIWEGVELLTQEPEIIHSLTSSEKMWVGQVTQAEQQVVQSHKTSMCTLNTREDLSSSA